MSKQLLIEHSFFTPTINLHEGLKNQNGNLIVRGKVQASDKPNANRRVYPYETLFEQVKKYVDGPIKEKRALGELDHPESSIINLKNVSHNILDLWWEGKDVFGTIEILPTPSGNILKELFLNNITVGISSRALGSTTPMAEGLVKVEEDLELICWDFVSQPSTYGSYMKPVNGLRESYDATIITQTQNKYTNVNNLMRDIICEMSGVCCIN